jgi:osomolarity two-component system sensor histidine kinase SLN1
VFYFAIAPFFSIPIVLMVIFDFPRDRDILYQLFLVFSVWIWPLYDILSIYLCGFYNQRFSLFSCGSKDFLGTFYYTSAMQTIALFGLKLNRFPATLGPMIFFIISCTLIIPHRIAWVRNLINFAVFHSFLIYTHYMRENAERRLYTLREQLKVQFKATQKAQVNERQAADSKRRLTSYVFHEVRVPLNTALLAVQNMDALGAVPKTQEIEFKALEGSLSMMSKGTVCTYYLMNFPPIFLSA